MNVIKTGLVLLLTIILSPLVWAESQFYFIAQVAPKGSITQAGQNEHRVYLRWDLLEGDLPDDIVRFSLRRNGSELKTFPASGVMDPVQIRSLYQGESEQRRLLETVSQLMEEAALDPNRLTFDADEYAGQIHDRLRTDALWANLASRMDFNLAMARYRAWRDEPEGSGVQTYTLFAFNDAGESRQVGQAEVDLDQPQQPLPPEGFDQVDQSSCDLPDFRDHYSVALNWAMPGNLSEADRLANQLFITGFDLYRTRDNVDTAPARDLAAEARNLPHDRFGQPEFADLERVNDTLLTITPDRQPLTPEWLETRSDLVAAGLQPGDKRAYYLVPRDISGQYGPTSETLVVIRDMARPPAPWNISPFLNESQQRVELTFRSPTIAGYREAWGRDRRFCNAMTAEEDGYLEYVADDEDCATDTPRRVQLSIEEYLVYRFTSFAEASRFKDSDGDGLADNLERDAGLQCDPVEPFAGYRIASNQELESLPTGEQVRLIDDTPASTKGDVYWYRLASRSDSGRLSLLSEPVRVNFPDRSLPEPPIVQVTQPGTELCGCTVDTEPSKGWSFFSELSSPGGGDLSLQCSGFAVSEYTLDPKAIAGSDSALCLNETFTAQCSDTAERHFTYTGSNGESANCTLPANSGVDMCQSNVSMRITPNYCEAQVPAPLGVVAGPLLITIRPENPAHCVSLNQQIDGDSVNLATSCNSASPILEYEHLYGEFCGFAVTRDANNNVSATTQIGCRSIPAQSDWTLAPAQPVSLMPAGDTRMALAWALPAQVQSMVEVELTRRDPAGLEPLRTRLPAVAQNGGGTQSLQLDVPARIGDSEQWCLRLRTFATTATIGQPRFSNWSAPLCEQRADDSVAPPEWLPWPQLADVPQGEPLSLEDARDIYTLQTETGGTPVPIASGLYVPLGEFEFLRPSDCDLPVYSRDVYGSHDTAPPESGLFLTDLSCNFSGYARARQVIETQLDFMVYRQARSPAGETSGFVQVTPMIDRVHWESVNDPKDQWLIGYRLTDPFVWAFADADQTNRVELAFYDRTGLLDAHEYRYQFVYFDSDKRLQRWRTTDWRTYVSGTGSLFDTSAEEVQ